MSLVRSLSPSFASPPLCSVTTRMCLCLCVYRSHTHTHTHTHMQRGASVSFSSFIRELSLPRLIARALFPIPSLLLLSLSPLSLFLSLSFAPPLCLSLSLRSTRTHRLRPPLHSAARRLSLAPESDGCDVCWHPPSFFLFLLFRNLALFPFLLGCPRRSASAPAPFTRQSQRASEGRSKARRPIALRVCESVTAEHTAKRQQEKGGAGSEQKAHARQRHNHDTRKQRQAPLST